MVQGISRKQNCGGGPCWSFVWPINLLIEYIAGPPTAVGQLMLGQIVEYLECMVCQSSRLAGHDELTTFRHGNPGLVGHTAATKSSFHKGIPAC